MKTFVKDFLMYFKFIFAAMFIVPIAIAILLAPAFLAFNYSYWFFALYVLIVPLYGGIFCALWNEYERTR